MRFPGQILEMRDCRYNTGRIVTIVRRTAVRKKKRLGITDEDPFHHACHVQKAQGDYKSEISLVLVLWYHISDFKVGFQAVDVS